MTLKEWMRTAGQGLRAAHGSALCVKCHQPLDATDQQEPKPNGMCSDCYYKELGDEIERHPIGNPRYRAPNIVVSNDGQKEKRQVVVTESFTYKTKYDDVMVLLTMNDGSVFYGWDYRELEDGK